MRPARCETTGELAGDPEDAASCVLVPDVLARCVPGATLIEASEDTITARVRLKVAATPSTYLLRACLARMPHESAGGPEQVALTLDGTAEEQRTGRPREFRIKLALAPASPGRTRCHIGVELRAGLGDQMLLDRLTPQFLRRLEDAALAPPEPDPSLAGPSSGPQAPRRACPWDQAAPLSARWRALTALGVATAAAVALLARRVVQRRHETVNPL